VTCPPLAHHLGRRHGPDIRPACNASIALHALSVDARVNLPVLQCAVRHCTAPVPVRRSDEGGWLRFFREKPGAQSLWQEPSKSGAVPRNGATNMRRSLCYFGSMQMSDSSRPFAENRRIVWALAALAALLAGIVFVVGLSEWVVLPAAALVAVIVVVALDP
jgi:hypothetical protein